MTGTTATTRTEPAESAATGSMQFPEDPRPQYAKAVAVATELIASVRPDDLTSATPCESMDVRDLLAHLVMVVGRLQCAARGDAFSTWPVEDTSVADDRWLDTWTDAAAKAEAAWSDATVLDRTLVLPWAEMSGREALATYINEVVVHSWDLAQAIGATPHWDDEAVAVAEAALRSQLPMAERDEFWAAVRAQMPPEEPWEDPFASAVEAGPAATPIDRLVAWAGRTP